MKERKVYWRRKGKTFIAEGQRNKKTIYLFTLPSVEEVLNSSLFTKEKQDRINEKIFRLDYESSKVSKQSSKVHTINIVRTPEKDEENDNSN